MAKYVFDSNIFINLQRHYPYDMFMPLWDQVNDLMASGIIISSREVYDEVVVGKDQLVGWVKNRKESFLPTAETVQREVRSILASYRGLVEAGKKKNSADPFVIALAKLNQCTVVTEEAKTNDVNSPKIPDVCDALQITCINLIEFLKEVNFHL